MPAGWAGGFCLSQVSVEIEVAWLGRDQRRSRAVDTMVT